MLADDALCVLVLGCESSSCRTPSSLLAEVAGLNFFYTIGGFGLRAPNRCAVLRFFLNDRRSMIACGNRSQNCNAPNWITFFSFHERRSYRSAMRSRNHAATS
ncbi:hypothetical protein MRX96_030351 [Rhipicephalus microplus]